MDWIKIIAYIITFIVSAGMTAIGIMVSYQIYQTHKKPVFSILLYQQIFLFSFLIYASWGNMALHTIINDLNINQSINAKLAFFIPIIGVPFMLVSWFMLLKFAYNLNGYRFSKAFVFLFFPTLVVLVSALGFLIHNDTILIPSNPDLFVVRILVGANLLIHLFFVLPFFKPKRNTPLLKECGFDIKWSLIFLLLTVVYSLSLSFITTFGFISICVSVILLFASGVFIPVKMVLHMPNNEDSQNMDFAAFCKFYEISKREAEIILEICSGKSNKAISENLFITLQTVKDHNHRIYTKTGVKSRVQLANLVREKTGLN